MDQSGSFAAPRRQDTGGSSSGAAGTAGIAGSSSVSTSQPASALTGGQQQQQQQQLHQPDELHMSGMSASPQRQHMSPESYATSSNPQIKLDHPPPPASAQPHLSYQGPSANSVPNVLQPGGLTARPPPVSSNTAPALPTIQSSLSPQDNHQQHDYSTAAKPTLNMSHTYSRSSPGGAYDTPGSYHAYTPTTPGGTSASSQFMSPSDVSKYTQPGSQRHISNTPLGLADIRPRADSSMSDGGPGTLSYDLANAQAGTSNYMAPWPIYAFDWCKWRPQANGAGKLAVGSYLEDGHNFVSDSMARERLFC